MSDRAAEAAVIWLERQIRIQAALLCLCLIVLPFAALWVRPTAITFIAIAFAVVTAFAASALLVWLVFDAVLFRLMASYPDAEQGGAAIDDFLARTRLKPKPDRQATLEERIAGTRGLLYLQRSAFAAHVVALAVAMITVVS